MVGRPASFISFFILEASNWKMDSNYLGHFNKRYVSIKEFCRYMPYHPQTVYQDRNFPGKVKDRGKLFIDLKACEQYLKQNTVAPPVPQNPVELLGALRDGIMLGKKGGLDKPVSNKKTYWNYGKGFTGIYIRKDSKGRKRFYMWYYQNGRRKRECIKDALNKEQAQIALLTKIDSLFKENYGMADTKKEILFKDYAIEYMDYAKARKKSYKSDERYLSNHLIPFFGNSKLSEITPLHVKGFISKKLDSGLKKSSINRYLQIMRSLLNIAKEDGYSVGDNPVRQKDLFDETEFRRKRILTHEEELKLFKESSMHLKPVIRYALLSGCRKQEILGLRRGDIDLVRDEITIRPEINKTGKLDIIPIHSELKKFLAHHLSMNGKSDSVFTYVDQATKELKPLKDICNGFYNACRRAGIKDLQFRDLRTTAATRWHERGVDPLIISRAVLRHSSFKMSEDFYIHSSIQHMKDALNGAKIDTLLPHGKTNEA